MAFIDTEYGTWDTDPVALEKFFLIYPDVKVVVVAHLVKLMKSKLFVASTVLSLLKMMLSLLVLHIKVSR